MPSKPWSEVSSSPQYQALPPAEKEAARRQYFDEVVAPQVPAPEREAARAEFDAQTAYSPGPGKPANEDQQMRDMMRDTAQVPGTEIVPQFIAGATEAGLGAGQLAAHVNLPQRLLGAGMKAAGLPDPVEQIDDYARQFEAQQAADPGAQTGQGKAARFAGNFAATAPLGGLVGIPAKGTALLPALTRTAAGGALVAGMSSPVDGDNFAVDKTKQMAGGGLLAAGVAGTGRAAMRVGEHLFPGNAAPQIVNLPNYLANKTPYAAEGEALAQRTGVRMTPGQVSGSRAQTALENMARQSVFSADKALAADQRIADDTIRYVRRLQDNLSKNPASEAAVGTQIQTVTRGAVEKIATQRDKVAGEQYGAIDKALAGRAFVKPTNALREADAIIAEYGRIPTPEAKRIVAQAQAMKAQLAKTEAFTFTEAQKSRSYFGKGARGGTNPFDDVSGDINREFATRFFKAFDADIEASANALSGQGPGLVPHGTVGLQDAIRAANANYRNYSGLIEYTKASPIARLFGDQIKVGEALHLDQMAPEVVLQRLGNMKPTELQMVRRYMQANDAPTWQQYKRLLVENALAEARTLPTSAGANTVPFNAARFVKALGGDKPDKIKQLQAIFDPHEFREIDEAFNVARRLGDRFGYNGSGTGQSIEVQNLLKSIKGLSYGAIASTGGEAFGLRKIANVMLSAEGRRALVQLSKLPPGSRQAASLVGLIAALASGQQDTDGGVQRRANAPHH